MSSPSSSLVRALQLFAYGLAGVCALLVICVTLITATDAGNRFVGGLIGRLASNPGRIVTIDGLHGLLSGRLQLDSATLSDAKGPYAVLSNLTVTWSPLALLSRRFEATEVTAGRLSLMRQPMPEPTSADTNSSTGSDNSFSLPVAIDVKHLAVARIELGKPLFGKAATLSLTGTVSADSQTIDTDLALDRIDAAKASLTAKIGYAPAENRLVIDAHLKEAKDGLLVTMMQLPGSPALDLDLAGSGPLNDWRGTLKAALDGTPRLTIDATHKSDATGRMVTLKGAGQFASLAPPAFRSLLSGDTDLNIAAHIGKNGAIAIETGHIDTGSMTLTASGTYDPEGQNDLTASLTGKKGPIAITWPLDKGELQTEIDALTFALKGPAQKAGLMAEAKLKTLSLPEFQAGTIALTASAGQFDLTRLSGSIDARLDIAQASSTNPDLNRALQGPTRLSLPLTITNGKRLTVEALRLTNGAVDGTATGTYDLTTKAADAIYRLAIQGEALPKPWSDKIKDKITLSGKMQYSSERGLNLPGLNLASNLLSAKGSASLADGKLTADLAGRLNDLGALQNTASGAADFSLSATGPLDALAAKARVEIAKAKLAGHPLSDFLVTASADLSRTAPNGKLNAKGKLSGKDVVANLNLTSQNGLISLPDLNLTVGENRLDGSLQLDKAFLPSGKLSFHLPDLDLLSALAGQSAAGDIAGALDLDAKDGKIAATLNASGTTIKTNGIVIDKPDVNITSTDLAALALQGTVKAAHVASGTNSVDNPVVTLNQADATTTIDLKAGFEGAPLSARAQLSSQDKVTVVTLQSFAAAPRGIAVTLSKPARITLADGGATIDALMLKAGSGTITLAGKAGNDLNLTGTLASLPASLANGFSAGLDAEGDISGKLTATGTSQSPKAAFSLTWDGARVAPLKSAGLPPLKVDVSGDIADNRLTAKTSVTGAGVSVSGGGTLGLSGTKPLDMRFTAAIPLDAAQGLLTPQGLVAQGKADGTVSLSGTLAAPAISGSVTADKARLIDVQHNIALENIKADIGLSQDTITVNSLTGTISAGGKVAASGTIGLKGEGLPADLAITLDHAVYVDGSLVTATADGKLTLKGPLTNGGLLSGKLRLDKTAITIPSKLPGSIAELNIRHIHAPPAVRQQIKALDQDSGASAGPAKNAPLALDLTLSAPSQIFVRGRGIDAELGGTVAITGTVAAPQVSGAFNLTRGRIVILTKRLDFSSGKITFGGGLIPIIDFVASSTSGSTTLNANVEGIATDPDISFSSSPALPQDEVLAQLIFGQSMSKLSPLQIAQLADAVSQLAGGRSTSLFTSLRSAIGVDDLDISTDSKGGTSVGVGKYLNNKTYLEFQQSSEGSKAIINLDVGKGVKLKGEAGASGSTGGGIYYEKEY
ncbi:translocation/assembly module TamB [Allorhizobium sp. BGMRC 0089]|uniref:translocation/assembly module TamB domain-containing protein n=1 Tax=Allorhizobium sonneratiae TaxID=2934936 RepID=UPI002033EA96|nr:translocation/assembly module TamB domain-containing protein [Allorhizobium sonneratiae]MCM2293438.1 translocation/assembly module TamB [Allorhizobium sonneratiae]